MIVIVFVVVCALVATAAIDGFRVSGLAASLAKVVSYSKVIQKDVKAADLQSLSTDLVHLDDLTQDMLSAASDPFLAATLNGLPVVGKNLDAARTVASAIAGLTSSARPLATLLPELEPDKLVVNGRYNIEALSKLDAVMQDLDAQLTVSNNQLASIQTSTINSAFAEAIGKISPAISGAGDLVGQVEPLVRILPIVLGGKEKRTWFVALQNLAEARATGGILGAYSVLSIDDGAITMTKSGSDLDLIPTDVPLDGVPTDLVSIWGSKLHEVRSTNLSSNFPDTGRLFANEWKAVSGEDVDGVLAFGQGTVQYMLAATGPITIDGQTVDAKNVVEFLSYGVYAKYPDATDKNAFVAKLVAQIFTRIQAGEFDLESLLTSTTATPTSDRIQAWSPNEALQKQITDAHLGGVLPTSYGPTTAVAINNGAGNKLDQYLHMSVDYELGECDPANYQRVGSMTITLKSDAPASGLAAYVAPESLKPDGQPIGTTIDLVSVYAPVNSGDTTAKLDGDDVSGYVGNESGRPLFVFGVTLKPGQTRTLAINWKEPIAGPSVVDILGSNPSVITAPSLNPITVTSPRAQVCKVNG